jgi:hypothetical protein
MRSDAAVRSAECIEARIRGKPTLERVEENVIEDEVAAEQ